MSFLDTESLKKEIPAREMIVPYDEDRIEQGKYELSVAGEYFHTAMDDGKRTANEGQQILIPPGQLAILLTHETVKVPNDLIGFISIKFGAKVRGLINVSGFHVDPGFHGRLKFSVYNAGSSNALVDPFKPLFQIWFSKLIQPENAESAYNNSHKHQNQKSITASDVEHLQQNLHSPAALARQIDDIKSELRYYRVFGGMALAVILGTVLVPAFKWAVEYWYEIDAAATQAQDVRTTTPQLQNQVPTVATPIPPAAGTTP